MQRTPSSQVTALHPFVHTRSTLTPRQTNQLAEKKSLDELMSQYREEMEFYMYMQYLCNSQMLEVKRHAQERGIFLKGDIPFLVSGDSADVWYLFCISFLMKVVSPISVLDDHFALQVKDLPLRRVNQRLFKMEYTVGAPPDQENPDGQDWGALLL
jgi:4-alpha-glucanotransferase